MKQIDLGKVGEYQFATELFKRGFVPLWPSAESIPYDLVFLNSRRRAVRVQVKTTGQSRINLNVGINVSKKAPQRDYTKADIDLLAIYALRFNIWFIIPVESLSRSIAINPFPEHGKGKWSRFKEAWHLLDAK